MRGRPDPRIVPFLVRAIREDPSPLVVEAAIKDLAIYPCPEAVEGLVDSFSVDFSAKSKEKKTGYQPDYQAEITRSLIALTGQSLPPDREKWAAWWRENRAGFKGKIKEKAPEAAPR